MSDETLRPAASPGELAWLEMGDLGNAMRLEARAAGKLIFVKDVGWFGWDGKSWRSDDGERLAIRLAHETARGIAAESKFVRDLIEEQRDQGEEHMKMLEERANKLAGWSVRSGDRNRTVAMLVQAQSYLNVKREQLDPDPFALNVQNGILRFTRNGPDGWGCELEPHAPEARMTRIAAAAYDPKATAPKWESHLVRCLPSDGVRQFFQHAAGYTFTGSTREQIIVALQGKGGDGKSTAMNILRRVGGDYGTTSDIKTWLEGSMRGGADASPDLARLGGDVRLCSTGEPPRNAVLNDGLIKSVTGGTPILARHLGLGLFEYRPSFKLWIEMNKRIRIGGDDDGIWRRVKLILWPNQIPKEERVKTFEDDVVEQEASGVLNWIIAGIVGWLNEGLNEPDEMKAAIEDYRRSSNPFGEWWMDRVIADPSHRELSSTLFHDYEAWSKDNGHEPVKQAAFGRALADRQVLFAGKDAKGRVTRKGARLRPNELRYGDDDRPPHDGYEGPG
jgi:putative DNA primase/helicase